ncbi:hypothetical protein TNCV_23151 [Trichonephila clavipes]|nr:hypothetical protein TNCV_23151 [Trichonephila clavipes]
MIILAWLLRYSFTVETFFGQLDNELRVTIHTVKGHTCLVKYESRISKCLEKEARIQEDLDLLQNLPWESNNALTDDFSDEEVPANNLLEFSSNS